jgi:hypothetical protein
MKRLVLAPLFAAAALMVSGCLSMRSFVDPTLGDVPSAQRVTVAEPRPVQLIFEFRTQGAANARATNLLREQVTENVRSSGVFSEVSPSPVAGGALLSIVIDNIPEEGAAQAGFGTGLTFGLAGTTVSDFYVASARYSGGAGGVALNSEKRHALHSQIGNAEAPANMVQAENTEAGVRTVIRQLVEHLVFDLARQPGFTPAPAAPALEGAAS